MRTVELARTDSAHVWEDTHYRHGLLSTLLASILLNNRSTRRNDKKLKWPTARGPELLFSYPHETEIDFALSLTAKHEKQGN